jgi:hypothetical protein
MGLAGVTLVKYVLLQRIEMELQFDNSNAGGAGEYANCTERSLWGIWS